MGALPTNSSAPMVALERYRPPLRERLLGIPYDVRQVVPAGLGRVTCLIRGRHIDRIETSWSIDPDTQVQSHSERVHCEVCWRSRPSKHGGYFG